MSAASQIPDAHSPKVRGVVWSTLQTIFYPIFHLWLGLRAHGHDRLEKEDGALILANHQSFLDPLVIGMPLRRPVSFLARHSLFPVPVVGWVLTNTHVMSINQQAASSNSLRDTIQRLNDGWLVGIFPEGSRSQTGAMGELKPGFAAILRRSKRPVYPVGIAGAYQALPLGGWFVKPRRVCVVFGEPLMPEELEMYSRREHEAQLIQLVESRIAACFKAAEMWRTTGKLPQDFLEKSTTLLGKAE